MLVAQIITLCVVAIGLLTAYIVTKLKKKNREIFAVFSMNIFSEDL